MHKKSIIIIVIILAIGLTLFLSQRRKSEPLVQEVKSDDQKVLLKLPAQALPRGLKSSDFTIKKVGVEDLPEEFRFPEIFSAYQIEPSGTKFNKPASIELVLDASVQAVPLVIVISDNKVEFMEQTTLNINPAKKDIILSAALEHTSYIALMWGLVSVRGPDTLGEKLVGEPFTHRIRIARATQEGGRYSLVGDPIVNSGSFTARSYGLADTPIISPARVEDTPAAGTRLEHYRDAYGEGTFTCTESSFRRSAEDIFYNASISYRVKENKEGLFSWLGAGLKFTNDIKLCTEVLCVEMPKVAEFQLQAGCKGFWGVPIGGFDKVGMGGVDIVDGVIWDRNSLVQEIWLNFYGYGEIQGHVERNKLRMLRSEIGTIDIFGKFPLSVGNYGYALTARLNDGSEIRLEDGGFEVSKCDEEEPPKPLKPDAVEQPQERLRARCFEVLERIPLFSKFNRNSKEITSDYGDGGTWSCGYSYGTSDPQWWDKQRQIHHDDIWANVIEPWYVNNIIAGDWVYLDRTAAIRSYMRCNGAMNVTEYVTVGSGVVGARIEDRVQRDLPPCFRASLDPVRPAGCSFEQIPKFPKMKFVDREEVPESGGGIGCRENYKPTASFSGQEFYNWHVENMPEHWYRIQSKIYAREPTDDSAFLQYIVCNVRKNTYRRVSIEYSRKPPYITMYMKSPSEDVGCATCGSPIVTYY